MTVRDSIKAKRAKKEEAAIATLNEIKAAMIRDWPDPKSGNFAPTVINAAEEGNVDSTYMLMGWFIDAVVKGQTPHPLLQGYFAFCFAKILGGVNPRQALNLKFKNGITAGARAAKIVAHVSHLIEIRGQKPMSAMLDVARARGFTNLVAGRERIKNIVTKAKNKKSILLRVKK